MGEELLTPRILNIPHTLAKKYHKGRQDLYDDIVSAAGEGLTIALQTYDPTKSAFATHAMNHARYKTWEIIRRRTSSRQAKFNLSILSLDEQVGEGEGESLACLVEEKVDPSWEAKEVVTYLLRGLPQLQRTVIRLRMSKKTLKEIGEALGRSHQGARNLEYKGMEKMRKKLIRSLSPRRHNAPPDSRLAWQGEAREKQLRARRLQVIERRVTGELPKARGARYIVNDQDRTIYGPGRVLSRMLRDMGHEVPIHSQGGGASIKAMQERLTALNLRATDGWEAIRLHRDGYKLLCVLKFK